MTPRRAQVAREAITPGISAYSKGWKAPWARDWGGFGDGHCRLARLARSFERDLLCVYDASTPLAKRSIWRAARYMAMSEMRLTQFGTERGVSISSTTRPAMVAERILLRLKRKDAVAPLDLARAIQAHQQRPSGGTS